MTGYQGTKQARLVSRLEIPSPNDCWKWQGACNWGGYGQMRDGLVHRVAYEVFIGDIPDGAVIDHVCHNIASDRGECEGGVDCEHRKCCNPWHLRAVTQADNINSGSQAFVEGETCKNGHLNAVHRRRSPKGQTYCNKCRSEWRRKNRERLRLNTQERRLNEKRSKK